MPLNRALFGLFLALGKHSGFWLLRNWQFIAFLLWIRTKFLISAAVGCESGLILTRCELGFPGEQEVGVASEQRNSLNVLFSTSPRAPH